MTSQTTKEVLVRLEAQHIPDDRLDDELWEHITALIPTILDQAEALTGAELGEEGKATFDDLRRMLNDGDGPLSNASRVSKRFNA